MSFSSGGRSPQGYAQYLTSQSYRVIEAKSNPFGWLLGKNK